MLLVHFVLLLFTFVYSSSPNCSFGLFISLNYYVPLNFVNYGASLFLLIDLALVQATTHFFVPAASVKEIFVVEDYGLIA